MSTELSESERAFLHYMTSTPAGHCWHEEGVMLTRYCCWCDIEETSKVDPYKDGPFMKGDQPTRLYWPSGKGTACPERDKDWIERKTAQEAETMTSFV